MLRASSSRPYLLSHLVIGAADRSPEAVGLIGTDRRLDHEEVAERVAKLATAMRAEGVEPGDRVAVFAPKSTETFIAMHAAIYAGAIAVPVDPLAPPHVLAELARDLEPRAIVAADPTAGRWPDPTVLTIGAASEGRHLRWDEVETAQPAGPVDRMGGDPAYIISTSGSTGRPKSIVHTHSSGLRYAELAAGCYDLRADDRMANIAPFHFDQSTFELYAAPLAGAATVLVPDVLLRFPASVSELLEREGVTTWYSVPTILRQLRLRGALDQRDLSTLRWVLFGGELFPPSELRALMAALPAARFSNVYGPAEVNQCTFQHLDCAPSDDEVIPIGRAWGDTDLRIHDDEGRILEGTGHGELQVRTATAMAGYWGRADLDDAAFEIERVDGGLTQRWYRTGDLVERDSNGVLTFVGRVDRQVKVRGVRIELEAVEAALDAVDGVVASAAVVVDDPDAPLVGIVQTSTIDDAPSVVRAVRATLSAGAVPDRIVLVDSLPRTTSGKVDLTRVADLVDTPLTPNGDDR